MIRGNDLIADFLDFKGPKDTGPLLDERLGEVKNPTLRLDLDYPNISRELATAPTDQGVMSFLKARAGTAATALVFSEVRYRRSSSGNIHVEIDLAGEYPASTVIALRSLLGDDDFRVLCDSRRALKNPIYLGGYFHDAKWIPGQKDDGTRGNIIARAGDWKIVEWPSGPSE